MTDIDKNEHNICESTTRACRAPLTARITENAVIAWHTTETITKGFPVASFPRRQKLPTTEVLKPSAATAE